MFKKRLTVLALCAVTAIILVVVLVYSFVCSTKTITFTKKYPAYILLATLPLAQYSCQRRPLIDEYQDYALIPVSIDWSQTKLDPATDKDNLYRASVWLFPLDGKTFNGSGKTYKEFMLESAVGGYIHVPVGRYAVLIFNNSISEFSSTVGFRGTDLYETFEYYIKTNSSRDPQILNEPDILGVWRTDYFEVTRQMVYLGQENITLTDAERAQATAMLGQLQGVKPELLTYNYKVQARVQKLISSYRGNGSLKGVAKSVFLAHKHTTTEQGTQNFILNGNRVYDDPSNPKDGVVTSATFVTLGTVASSSAQYGIDLQFQLQGEYEGSLLYPTPPNNPFMFNVTDQIVSYHKNLTSNTSGTYLKINLGTNPNNPIVLPEVDKVENGFDAEIDDWEEENIDIPI